MFLFFREVDIMFILRCDQNRNLEFIKKERIIQGEHCFDSIKVELPENIGEYLISDLSIKMKFVSGSGYIDRQVIAEDGAIYTDIDYTLTETAKRWLFYLTFYYNNDEDIEIGKTNSIAIQINRIPYSEKLKVKNKEPEIVMIKGDKGDKGDPGADGKDGQDYVLTPQDKTDIADIVLGKLPTTQGVLYGNTNN